MRRIRLAAATVIAAIAVVVIAVTAASAGARKYDTRVTINYRSCYQGNTCFVGRVKSEVRKCVHGRRVVLFKQRHGADRRIGTDNRTTGDGSWGLVLYGARPDRVYAKVTRERHLRYVCLADRSRTI
jgi:hypothetical protein